MIGNFSRKRTKYFLKLCRYSATSLVRTHANLNGQNMNKRMNEQIFSTRPGYMQIFQMSLVGQQLNCNVKIQATGHLLLYDSTYNHWRRQFWMVGGISFLWGGPFMRQRAANLHAVNLWAIRYRPAQQKLQLRRCLYLYTVFHSLVVHLLQKSLLSHSA